MSTEPETHVAPTPPQLGAPGTSGATFRPLLAVSELPPGTMRRVTVGELDLLVAHLADGVMCTDDRCPHMSAPLSLGSLDGCTIACPLHSGRFDLCTGDTVQMPNTGGLDADGASHLPYAAPGTEPKPDPPSIKAEARRYTRTRRLRYYPVRIRSGWIEVAVPPEFG